MRHSRMLLIAAAFAVAASAGPVAVHAQLMDTLKKATGVGQGGALGNLGGLSMPSVGGASSGNIAGMLEYCVRNKLVGGAAGTSVQDTLVSKLGGPAKENHDPGFSSGSKGLLESGGNGFDMNSLTAQMKEKVCYQVLQHAKSLI